jgi:methionyl-tRNA synthetase
MSNNPFYITTAIFYVNGVPHLGHAYEMILTDVMARFQRALGRDVYFLTGTDEHGEKVSKTAEQNDISPRDFADKNADSFREATQTLDISSDDFIRTTEDRHHKAAQAMWKTLQERGDIYLGKYEGWYSVREEGYFTESELIKDEQTGALKTPNGTEVKWVEESSYFFRLSNYTDKLLELYDGQNGFIQPQSRANEIKSFVKEGLRDLSISRHKDRLAWGIPVPCDKDHVMYVWLDALTNYLTGLGYPQEGAELYNKYWPCDWHVIGKDIIRFHAVYWPAFLMAAGIPLPKHIFAHGFINVDGEKMSKSIGNVLSPDGLVETYGLDQIRYFLMREIAHGQDGNFGHEQAITRINADLANGMGNLAQRTLSMIYKNCDGAYPQPGIFEDVDKALLKLIRDDLVPKIEDHLREFKIHRALEAIWHVVGEANGYIDVQAPWTLKKENPERMRTVLYVLADVIRCLGIAISPITPGAAQLLLDQMGVPEEERLFEHMSEAYTLKPGTAIDKPEGIFPRLEDPAKNDEAAQNVD